MPFLQQTTTAAARLLSHPKSHHIGPVTLAYQRQVQASNLRFDSEQLSLCSKLDSLYLSFTSPKKLRDRLLTIPDEHLEEAARYYSHGSTSSSSKKFFSTLSNNIPISSVAFATAHSFMSSSSSSFFFPNEKHSSGIYIHGSVGVGKSMLMDLFHSICTKGLSIPKDDAAATATNDDDHDDNNDDILLSYNPIKLNCKRYHFHEFMIRIHQQIHTYKSLHPKQDAIPYISAKIAQESRLLCLDEMQITDIADAMILKRIVTLLIELGVVIVTTSNRPPGGLYEGGINRLVFMPLVHVLMERLMIVEMKERIDYRKEKGMKALEQEESLLLLDSCNNNNNDDDDEVPSLSSYLVTSNLNDLNMMKEVLKKWFSKGGGTERQETLPVAMGRTIHVKRANDSCAWFNFQELCHQPLGAADYIAIAERFDMVIVDDVPQMSGHCYNEARRFVIFVDALYEARTKLIISADVPRHALFLGFDATVDTNDGDEEIAVAAIAGGGGGGGGGGDTFVIGEGGSSSSSSTTMIRTNNDKTVEWSATGRIGVSLAQLSAVKEVSFSFQRAESRLAEMSLASWGR
jgi:protein AFG1